MDVPRVILTVLFNPDKRQLVLNSLAVLLPEPMVRANAPTTAQITVTRQEQESRTMVHVIHYIPERRAQTTDTIQDVIPLHDVRVALRCETAPSKVYLTPDGQELESDWRDRYVEVRVPKVEGYAVVVCEW